MLYASAEAKRCLLDVECSGLFKKYFEFEFGTFELAERRAYGENIDNGNPDYFVYKYDALSPPALSYVDPEEDEDTSIRPLRYWIQPGTDDTRITAIADHIMPTLEQWTHRTWEETTEPNKRTLKWYNRIPQVWKDRLKDAPAWAQLFLDKCKSDRAAGCAVEMEIVLHSQASPGIGQILQGYRSYTYTVDQLYLVGLHEAMHALYDAEHTTRGLMSHDLLDTCPREVGRIGGRLGCNPSKLDIEVYTLYGNPLLTHGMSKELVEQIVQVR